jgi:hypothetical protein
MEVVVAPTEFNTGVLAFQISPEWGGRGVACMTSVQDGQPLLHMTCCLDLRLPLSVLEAKILCAKLGPSDHVVIEDGNSDQAFVYCKHDLEHSPGHLVNQCSEGRVANVTLDFVATTSSVPAHAIYHALDPVAVGGTSLKESSPEKPISLVSGDWGPSFDL